MVTEGNRDSKRIVTQREYSALNAGMVNSLPRGGRKRLAGGCNPLRDSLKTGDGNFLVARIVVEILLEVPFNGSAHSHHHPHTRERFSPDEVKNSWHLADLDGGTGRCRGCDNRQRGREIGSTAAARTARNSCARCGRGDEPKIRPDRIPKIDRPASSCQVWCPRKLDRDQRQKRCDDPASIPTHQPR